MKFRLVEDTDIKELMLHINEAKEDMKKLNIDQWQDGEPNESTIQKYVRTKNGFTNKERTIFGALVYNDEDYKELMDVPYAVIHTFFVSRKSRGNGDSDALFRKLIEIAKNNGVKTIGIDTHKDNAPMLAFIKRHGFKYIGDVLIGGRKPRIAFQLDLEIKA